MHQTWKGNQWYLSTPLRSGFGTKIRVGADVDSGLAYTGSVTPENVADITELRGGRLHGVALKARPKSRLGTSQKQKNRKHSSTRSPLEYLFRVIKCQFDYTKVRYKGLAKNAAQVFMLIGMTPEAHAHDLTPDWQGAPGLRRHERIRAINLPESPDIRLKSAIFLDLLRHWRRFAA